MRTTLKGQTKQETSSNRHRFKKGYNENGAMIKDLSVNAGDTRDTSSIPGLGRYSEVGSGNPLQYPHLKISMVREVWQAIVHGIAKNADFPGGSDGKASVYNMGDPGLIPGPGRSPGEGNGSPLQCSCLENPMDGGAWWATVHGVAKSRT